MERVTKIPNNKAYMNEEAYRLLVDNILRPSAPSVTKTHEQLVWDECKRHILACIEHNIQVNA